MSFIKIKLIEGVFSGDQKKQIADDLADAVRENQQPTTHIIVDEIRRADWEIDDQIPGQAKAA